MEKHMKDSLLMIKEKDKGNLLGKMVGFMMVCGRMENNMEEVNSFLKIELKELENGRMERKLSGYLLIIDDKIKSNAQDV
jgi:hypothetical protein